MKLGDENTSAVLEMDDSYFTRILQALGCPWCTNKLPSDEEKCSVLLSYFPLFFNVILPHHVPASVMRIFDF